MKRKKTKIRLRILTVYSVMLLLSFFMIGLIFNIAATRYIQISAASQLDATYNNMLLFMEQARNFIERQSFRFPEPGDQRFEDYVETIASLMYGLSQDYSRLESLSYSPFTYSSRHNALQIIANVFIIDDDYNFTYRRDISDETTNIVQAVKKIDTQLADLRNLMVRTDGGVYYVSAFKIPDNPLVEKGYFIIYADVTGLLSFAATVNVFLIVLVFTMFIITVIVTFFLSNSITRPIEKISVFASRIGRSDFSTNDYTFNDEEFENLNIALNNSAKQLRIYDNEQKAFFQNVSHELRTPLMSIQCQAEGISFDLMEPKKASETILSETHRLSDMVTDLLYISKIDNITTVYETMKVDLLEIIRSCARRQQLVAEKKGIRFSYDFTELSVEYECASELISRALDNLIANAIRYALSEITLSCKRDQHNITLCVTDDGCGIEPESIPRVFERFYKTNGGNHGIGLSIVKSIVEQHHGSVTAKNNPKGGAEFTMTLPIKNKR